MDPTVGLWLIALSFLAIMFGPSIMSGINNNDGDEEGHLEAIIVFIMIMFFLIGVFTYE